MFAALILKAKKNNLHVHLIQKQLNDIISIYLEHNEAITLSLTWTEI